jgi:hypothetical protein
MKHYAGKTFTVSQFCNLPELTHQDKLWVLLRLVDNDIKVIFAMDCAFNAVTYVDAGAAAGGSSGGAGGAADAVIYAASAADAEKQRQLESLKYLIKTA